jgi:hypothetical protein
MLKLLSVLLGLALVSFTGQAVAAVGATTTFCSGIQTSSSIVGSPFSLSCAGDLSLSGGTLSDNLGIFLSSTGAMTLDNITVTAPSISFSSGAIFSMTPSVSLSGANVSIVGSTVSMNGNISVPRGTLGGTVSFVGLPPADANLNIGAGGNLSIDSGGNVSIGSGSLNLGNGGSLVIGGGIVNLVPNWSGSVVFPGAGGLVLVSPVPEPGTYILLLMGFICLIGFQRIVSHREKFGMFQDKLSCTSM